MSSKLQTNLETIINEKNTKIIPENLKVGIKAFGVTGNFTSDANATAGDILKDKTAYVNGEKVVGTLEMGAGSDNTFGGTLPTGKVISSAHTQIYTIIKEIPTEITLATTSCNNLFFGMTSLEKAPKVNTTGVKAFGNMFKECSALKDASNVSEYNTNAATSTSSMFGDCASLVVAPFVNTKLVTNMASMFSGCTNLTTLPVYDTSSATNMVGMVSNCSKLLDESLNNVMQMCINQVNVSGTHATLKTVGLSSAQATRCQSLSNYQALIDAGWTTGY